MNILQQIDERIKARSILLHPFYQAWKQGELEREDLQEYARQYYHHVAAFPRYLSALHSRVEDIVARKTVLENLMDEELGAENHPELWARFADALGVERAELENSKPSAQTRAFVGHFMQSCRERPVAEAIAALYAYESQIPAVSAEKIQGLQSSYGVTDDRGVSYFRVHEVADVEHSAAERQLLEDAIANGADSDGILDAVEDTLAAYWLMLDGMPVKGRMSSFEMNPCCA